MYGTISMEGLEQRREEMLREALLNRLKKALRDDRGRSADSHLASTVAWELAKPGLLRKFLEAPMGAD